jgi:hypothetical protein
VQLFSKIFDENTESVEEHLSSYLESLYEDKVINQKSFSIAVSLFGDYISDLAIDFPQIHIYFWKYVMLPLLNKNVIDYNLIRWDNKVDKIPGDDDYIPETNAFFKLLALIYVDLNQKRGKSWKEVVNQHEKWK